MLSCKWFCFVLSCDCLENIPLKLSYCGVAYETYY